MAITALTQGTESSLVVGTEKFETNINVAGKFYFVVDLNAMVAGDSFTIRMYQMVLTGGTSRVVLEEIYDGPQAIPVKILGPVPNELTDAQSVRCSILQTLGTARTVLWKELQDSDASANSIATALLDLADAIETGWTVRKTLRVMAAVLGGKSAGAGGTTATFQNLTDTKTRITATVDAVGNRTAVTQDGT